MRFKPGRPLKAALVMALTAVLAGLTPLVQTASRASATCAPFAILGSRGSGQSMTADGGFGHPVVDFINSFEAQLPSAVAAQVTTWPNNYPAVSAPLNFWNAYVSWGPYGRSVSDGQTKLAAEISSITGSCGATTKIILAGYSQGAQVTANVYQGLTSTQLSDIYGVVLFGEPYFNPASQRAFGDFTPDRVGILAHPKSNVRPEFPNAADGKVLSYCHGDDMICQGVFKFRPLSCCILTPAGHTNYDTVGDATDATPYPVRAAHYFANRAGYGVTASAPTAGITPVPTAYVNRPFELSGASSSDPAGLPLTYAWDLTNSGTYSAPSSSPTQSATFTAAGTYTIKLKVTNSSGLSGTTSTTVNVVSDPDPGTLGVPTSPTVSLSSDGTTENVSWQSPTTGPAARGYAVFTPDGLPLGEITGSTGTAPIPVQALPPQVDIEALDDDGDGGVLTVNLPSLPVVAGIVDGAAVSHTVSSSSEAFSVTFYGTAGQTVYVNGTGGNFNASLTVYDPNGSKIATGRHNSFNSGTAESLIAPVNLPLSGGYTIYVVADAGSSGSISLQVMTYSTVSATVDGAAVSSSLTSSEPGRRIAATFTGAAAQTVYVNGTLGSFGATLSLLDPTGTEISTANLLSTSPGTATHWIAPVNLSKSGTYTLYITPDPGATGAISLQVLGSMTSVAATVDGSAVSASIPTSAPGREVAVTFTGTAAQTVYVNGTLGSFGATLSLLDPTGTEISTGNLLSTSPGTATNWTTPVNLNRSGTYTLYITPDAGATGTISLQILGSFVTASATVNGAPANLTIPASAPGKIMAVTFSASAGTSIGVSGITGAVGGDLTLDDPDGVVAATGAAIPLIPCPGNTPPGQCPQVLIAPVTVPLTGTYTLYFTPDAYDTGSVSISVTGASGSTSGVTFISASTSVDGAAASVTIPSGSANERVAVTFTGTAGQAVYALNHSTSATLTAATVSLVGPSGQLVVVGGSGFLDGDNSLLPSTGLPATGTYTLCVVPDSSTYGTVKIQVLSHYATGSATVDGAATPITIPSATPGQLIAVTFAGTASQAVYALGHSTGITLGTGGATVSLVGPSGQTVYRSVSNVLYGDNTLLPPTGLPTTGTYTLYIVPAPVGYGTLNLQVLSHYATGSMTVDGAATPITIPSTSPGQLIAATFTGTAGQAVYTLGHSTGTTIGTGGATVSLVDPSGQTVYRSVSNVLYGDNTLLPPTGLPTTGTYTLYIVPAPVGYGTLNLQTKSYTANSSAIEP